MLNLGLSQLEMFPKDKEGTRPSPARPLAPKLATKNAFIRSPPTAPRLAASIHSPASANSPVQSKPVAAASPNTPTSAQSNTTSASAQSSGRINDEDASGAVENSNITPRSKARQSKTTSPGSTPRVSTTKANAKQNSVNPMGRNPPAVLPGVPSPRSLTSKSSPATPTGRSVTKILTTGQRGLPLARPQVSPTPQRQPQDSSDDDLGNSFFHASQAPSNSPPRRPAPLQQTSNFVYANGQHDSFQSSATSRSASVVTDDQNTVGNSTLAVSPRLGATSISTSTTSAISTPVVQQTYSAILPQPRSLPNQGFHLSYRKGASQIIRPVEFSAQQVDNAGQEHRRRQSSLDTVPETTEQQKLSKTQSFSASATSPRSPPPRSVELPAVLSPHVRSMSVSSQKSGLGSVVSQLDEESKDAATSHQSVATQARQERKVLDLEISNSSLMAINRSLERELRKQKAEVRRYRRLSRNSNRVSWLSDATSPEPGEETEEPLEDDDDDDDDIDDDGADGESSARGLDDTTDLESVAEDTLSPAALEQHDAKYRRQDEKRLQLDLTKHKQLIIDSQKMNSSLKRCLGLSEQLIKDGGKALMYQVNVADIQLGGRVLSPEEVEMKSEWEDESGSYFYSKWRSENDRLSALSQRLLTESDLGTDKDSGVDLDYAGRLHPSLDGERVISSTSSDLYSRVGSEAY